MLCAILNKSWNQYSPTPQKTKTVHPFTSHFTNHPNMIKKHAGYNGRNKDEHKRDVFLINSNTCRHQC